MNINKDFRNKILKTFGVTVLILTVELAAIFYIVNYLQKEIEITKGKQRLLTIAKAERFNSVYLKNDFNKVENYLSKVNGALPDERNLLYAINQLEKIGQNNGNQISVQVNASQIFFDNAIGGRFIAFTAPFNGNYQSLRKYLDYLNANLFFVKIESVSFSGSPSINNLSSGSLSGKIYLK